MKLRHSNVGVVLFSLVLCVPMSRAQDGAPGAFSLIGTTPHAMPRLSSPLATADFDHDEKPDGAVLLETGSLNGHRSFRIEVHLTARKNDAISFSSAESDLSISALDVNQDGAQDIVIEKAFSRQRLEVYLNDGHGAFHRATAGNYPPPNPARPVWRARQIPVPSAVCVPVSRGFELGCKRRVSILRGDASGHLRSWLDLLVAPSEPRSPASSRAPPSPFSL